MPSFRIFPANLLGNMTFKIRQTADTGASRLF